MFLRKKFRITLITLLTFMLSIFLLQCSTAKDDPSVGYENRRHYYAGLGDHAAGTADYLIDLIRQKKVQYLVLLDQKGSAQAESLFEAGGRQKRSAAAVTFTEVFDGGAENGPTRIIEFTCHAAAPQASAEDASQNCVFILKTGDEALPLAARIFAEARILRDTKAKQYTYFAAWPEFSTPNQELNELINTVASNSIHAEIAVLGPGENFVKEPGKKSLDWLMTDYEITLFARNYVSIRFQTSIYTGGAHPNHWARSLVFAIRNDGSVRQISLADIFRRDSIGALTLLIQSRLRMQGATWLEEILLEESTFTLCPAGIRFTFDPYTAGPYSDGFYDVSLTWDEVAQYLVAERPIL
jgi:hypothetical protein